MLHEFHLTGVALFIAQVMVIVVAGRVLGWLARRIGQPMVIAEITAGICLGPSLLGWLAPEVMNGLFPKDSLPALGVVSQFGLVLFMFLVGLDLDPRLLKGRGKASVVISHSSIVVPFTLGAILTLYIFPVMGEPGVPRTSFMLFMGVAMSITAFPVLARILAERGLLRSRVGAITIACAAVDDVTAWCVLAFVVSIVRSSGVGEAVVTTVLALVYIGFMFFVARPFLARLGARGANRDGLTQNIVAITFLCLFASSLITEYIGIHALFGAFLMGAVMPREGGFTSGLVEKVEDLVVVVLLPLFFAYSGLRTQIGLLNSPSDWVWCGVVIAVACVGKLGGSALAARFMGLRWRESVALGILMNTRGLMELIVLNIGLDLGVISPTLFTIMVLMALVTTFLTSPMLQVVYPAKEMARDLMDEGESKGLSQDNPPTLETGYAVMLCVSDPRIGPSLVTLARSLVGESDGSSLVYALRLMAPPERPSVYLKEEPEEQAALGFLPLMERSRAVGLPIRPLSFVSSDPGMDIVKVASVKEIDLVLLGSHKPLLGRALLGGTVADVLSRAEPQVGVLADRGLRQVQRVLVATDDGEDGRAALAVARRLVSGRETQLAIVSMASSGTASSWMDEAGPVMLLEASHPDPGSVLLQEGARGYDLLVLGFAPAWPGDDRDAEEAVERVVSSSPVSVLVVRAEKAEERRS